MRIALPLATALAATVLAASPASAQDSQRMDLQQQDRAYEQRKQGRMMSVVDLERRILPRMSGFTYLGPEPRGDIYRFKFLRNGKVVWLDVDPRTGRIVRKFGL